MKFKNNKTVKMKKLKYYIPFIFLALVVILTFPGCKEEPPIVPDDNYKIKLSKIDSSLTEITLEVKLFNLLLPVDLALKRDGNIIYDFNLSSTDTAVVDTSLLPNTTYTYKATVKSGNKIYESNELIISTMDTTSQNFSFEVFEFGNGFSSAYLNDVWIFDENNVWAVGWVGPHPTISNPNIVRWNGSEWVYPNFSGTTSGMDGIWAIDSSHIYFASGGIRKYENGIFSNVPTNLGLTDGQRIEKLWGTGEDNIWGVGPRGTIVHYDGNQWKKIEFDRQWYFYNITGDPETGIAYSTARSINKGRIVKLQNSLAEVIFQSDYMNSITISYHNNNLYLVSLLSRIWKFNILTNEVNIIHQIDPSTIGISQSSIYKENDIYYIGDDYGEGKFIHFNGMRYTYITTPKASDNIGDAFAIKDFAVSVGFFNNKGYALFIRRN